MYWVSKLLQKGTQCKIYKILIRTAVFYGCQSWTIMNTDERKLSIIEGIILGKIYGPSCVNVVWRIKNRDEVFSLNKETCIMKIIKTAKLEWLGHIARMEVNVICMKIKFSQAEGSRKKRRPGIRWVDSVSKEFKTIGVNTRWRKQGIGMCGV
jgi:hypothetical protein